jgi:D-glycero-D-manno-heptose 1,7-bisphosphate phosphatase
VTVSSHRALRWAFIDRDGTINVSPARGDYIAAPDELRFLDGAALAIRRLNEAGIWVGIVTNQRGIALGRMTLADLEAVHERLLGLLASSGAHVDAVYVCPHQKGTCRCRKPLPGLLLQAQRDVGDMDLSEAVLIGDSLSDIQAGRAAGTMTVLLSSGATENGGADHVAPSLLQAVTWLLQRP